MKCCSLHFTGEKLYCKPTRWLAWGSHRKSVLEEEVEPKPHLSQAMIRVGTTCSPEASFTTVLCIAIFWKKYKTPQIGTETWLWPPLQEEESGPFWRKLWGFFNCNIWNVHASLCPYNKLLFLDIFLFCPTGLLQGPDLLYFCDNLRFVEFIWGEI